MFRKPCGTPDVLFRGGDALTAHSEKWLPGTGGTQEEDGRGCVRDTRSVWVAERQIPLGYGNLYDKEDGP